jgi:hypothetical protein
MPINAKKIVRIMEAITKSNNCDITYDKGNTSRGKYIFVTKFIFETRLSTENLIPPTKKAHGNALTDTEAICDSSMGLPLNEAIANLTTTPERTITAGIKIAHKKPMTVCLYFIDMFFEVSAQSRSRYFIRSLNISFIVISP